MTTLPILSATSEGVVTSRRSPVRVIASLIRNPLDALPPQIYDHKLVYTEFGNQVRLHLMDPELIHEALVKNAAALSKGEEVRRALGPALGQGLLTSDGAHWKWQRQSVASGFQWEKLRGFLPAMIAAAERRRDAWQVGDIMDIGHEMMRTTFDIIVETMMSGRERIDVGRVEQSVTDYLEPTGWMFALGLLKAPEWVPYPGKGKASRAVEYLRSAMADMINERRTSGEERADLVSMLLSAKDPETGREMSDEQIIDNLLTFISAGHETTALGLAWTLHLLARHPNIEKKMLDEFDRVVGEGSVMPEHIEQLTYTKQVFNESMRLYPPAPVITRTAEEDFVLSQHRIKAGTVLLVPIHAVHRHRLIWEEPEKFDPEHFAPDAVKNRHRYAFMPFGAGPRICIGSAFATMEAVAILAVLAKRFRLRNKSETVPEPLMRITLRPKEKLMMRVESRG
ncbi:cytochrome P450 [Allorhizobium taibaishanense]|uniref:Cytochrome P450 n=2 Tax=Allorhizobium taibaishanense TaxID=887144 RepID=A0A1Q9A170_9HYPH|nr:cytochrome P450 [Allorhizobium taibaishanense]MBB4007903.1 cytochrome P450 [Allorhizobium taibaishanense]OLP48227.1 cytochrome P450 [Allorhizobium taibaishanense]